MNKFTGWHLSILEWMSAQC